MSAPSSSSAVPGPTYVDKGKGKGKGKNKRWDRRKGQQLPHITYQGKRLPQCRKKIYHPHPTVRGWTQQDIDLFRFEHGIEVDSLEINGDEVPPPAPVDTLDLSTFPDEVLESLRKDMTIFTPTAIQMQVWPAAMSGRDLIGVSPTGSGKTLAYLLPMFEHCKAQPSEARSAASDTGPMALILVPNVDLARQIKRWFDKSRRASHPLKMECMVPKEAFPMTGTYDILVASPGRLRGFLHERCGDVASFFARTTLVVVDEADALMCKVEKDKEQDTLEILKQLRADVQMLYFSAVWDDELPREIGKICRQENGDAKREPLLSVVVDGKILSACKNVEQSFVRPTNGEADDDPSEEVRTKSAALNKWWLTDQDKEDALHKLLYAICYSNQSDPGNSKILVFANRKEKVAELADMLTKEDHPVVGLTAEADASQRDSIVTDFGDPMKTDKLILVTTDMLGRGMDFTTCKWVILYDFPQHKNGVREYVHRIGRTGRAGRVGHAITLLDEEEGDLRHCAEIAKILQASGRTVPKWIENESVWLRKHWQIFRRREEERKAETQEAEAAQAVEELEEKAAAEEVKDQKDVRKFGWWHAYRLGVFKELLNATETEASGLWLVSIKPDIHNEYTVAEWPELQKDLKLAFDNKNEPFFKNRTEMVINWKDIQVFQSKVEKLSEDLEYMTKDNFHAVICSVAEQHKDAVETIRCDFNKKRTTGTGFVHKAWLTRNHTRQGEHPN